MASTGGRDGRRLLGCRHFGLCAAIDRDGAAPNGQLALTSLVGHDAIYCAALLSDEVSSAAMACVGGRPELNSGFGLWWRDRSVYLGTDWLMGLEGGMISRCVVSRGLRLDWLENQARVL